MEKIRRNERMAAMLHILSESPNKLFTLSYFCEKFGSAKSTMSEDIDILRDVVKDFDLGTVETVTGAAGGVRFLAGMSRPAAIRVLNEICETLMDPSRVLPGNYLYFPDILSMPGYVEKMGTIIAQEYYESRPDFVLTMETKGIPVAFSAANALGVPLVIARRVSKVYEGSAVNINYVTGSSGSIETMSLSRRAVQEGQKCLIVDDFLRGGGTARGMCELMREFKVQVMGMAFVMATAQNDRKRMPNTKALMVMEPDATGEGFNIHPASWLQDA